MRGNGAKTGGTSFAALDLNSSVVTGLAMPKYAQDAIAAFNSEKYGKRFSFQQAGSAKSLQRQMSKLEEMGNMERVITETEEQGTASPVLSASAAHDLQRRK